MVRGLALKQRNDEIPNDELRAALPVAEFLHSSFVIRASSFNVIYGSRRRAPPSFRKRQAISGVNCAFSSLRNFAKLERASVRRISRIDCLPATEWESGGDNLETGPRHFAKTKISRSQTCAGNAG